MIKHLLTIFLLLFAFALPAPAEIADLHPAPGFGNYDLPFFPNGSYSPEVKSPDQFLGFTLGSKASSHAQIISYFEYLAETLPNAFLFDYGRSYEGRRLIYLVIASKDNAPKLDDIRNGLALLSDPRKLKNASDARSIIKNSPAVAWLAYGIHGDELSSCDAALQLAYQILAGRDDETKLVRDELIVVIDPLQNPDGRTRWLTQLEQWNGVVPSHDIQSLQHRGSWPYGRTNHYLFDLNRDWFSLVHPESRAKTAAVLEWMPHYFLDCHEMGPTDTYLFSPPREPFNPYMVEYIHKWWGRVASSTAKSFDQYGWSYYTREWNEEFFPGYGSSWSIYLGAVGMLFEQAGVDGSQAKRPEGTVMTYRETVHHQFVGSFANLLAVASEREDLLSDYFRIKLKNVRQERGKAGAFIFVPEANQSRLERFASTLEHQHIEVEVSTSSFKVGRSASSRGEELNNRTFPEGTLIVRTNQPLKQLIEAILQFDLRIPTSFLVTEKKEILKRNRTRIYETTAWSMPLAYDLDAYYTESLPGLKTVPYSPPETAGEFKDNSSTIGFVFDCSDDRSYHLLVDLLARGYKVRSSRRGFENLDTVYPRGSFQIRFSDNPEMAPDELQSLAEESGIDVAGIETSLGNKLADLGGEEFVLLAAPRIALVGGYPVSTSSFGAVWHLLDNRFGVRTSVLELAAVGRTDLDKYNVLVLPHNRSGHENYKTLLGKSGIDRLKKWVESGGTLLGIGEGAAFLADSSVTLSSVRQKRQSLEKLAKFDAALDAAKSAENPDVDSLSVWEGSSETREIKPESGDRPAEFAKIKEADERARRLFPRGTIMSVDLDEEHWLTTGCKADVPVLFNSRFAYLAGSGVEVPGRMGESGSMRLSGLFWPEARERWGETVYLSRESKGKGQVILFASQPNFRGYFYGSERLLLNALFLGPGFGTRRSIEW